MRTCHRLDLETLGFDQLCLEISLNIASTRFLRAPQMLVTTKKTCNNQSQQCFEKKTTKHRALNLHPNKVFTLYPHYQPGLILKRKL
jgi:hypothetical protein